MLYNYILGNESIEKCINNTDRPLAMKPQRT